VASSARGLVGLSLIWASPAALVGLALLGASIDAVLGACIVLLLVVPLGGILVRGTRWSPEARVSRRLVRLAGTSSLAHPADFVWGAGTFLGGVLTVGQCVGIVALAPGFIDSNLEFFETGKPWWSYPMAGFLMLFPLVGVALSLLIPWTVAKGCWRRTVWGRDDDFDVVQNVEVVTFARPTGMILLGVALFLILAVAISLIVVVQRNGLR
jgi:hypothetical protein